MKDIYYAMQYWMCVLIVDACIVFCVDPKFLSCSYNETGKYFCTLIMQDDFVEAVCVSMCLIAVFHG